MAVFKFSNFVFDSESYRLERNGEGVALRPKALQLLSLLIENSERVVSKSEIFTHIWGDEYARDHLLFQLVSELRKTPFQASFVRTKPNEGYRWNVATETVLPSKRPGFSRIAAGLAAGVVCMAASYFVALQQRPDPSMAQLPAHSAFSKGVLAMESGESEQAIEWFKFALNENPESVESSLFLAETLLQHNRPEESSEQLYALLAKPNLGPYNTMSATDLLSRIHQRQGQLQTALKYAQKSSQENVLAQCSVDMIENRVEKLSSQLGLRLGPQRDVPSQATQSPLLTGKAHAPANSEYDDESYGNQCNQLKQNPEETSYCPPDTDGQYYVYLHSIPYNEVS